VEARLLRSASGSLAQAQRQFWRTPLIPWADLEMCLLVAAIVYAVVANFGPLAYSLLGGDYLPLPPLGAEPEAALPSLPPELRQAPAPFGAEGGAGGVGDLNAADAQQALDELADALSGQTITQSAGAALAAGQAGEAASQLRELADAAGQISPEALRALGQSLEDAADQLHSTAPQAAQELGDAGRDLQSGDSLTGTGALDSLARLVEDLQGAAGAQGDAGSGMGDGNGAGSGLGSNAGRESTQGGNLDQLGDQDNTIELPQSALDPNEAGVLMPPTDDSPDAGQRRSTPYTDVNRSDTSVGAVSDPLSYPWRLRNVVQQYFSPP
jgi:HPt (histidine-containing phosphotransfer) domain-containing protein